MNNPFYHRGAIRHETNFYGRKRETEQMLGLLCKGQSVSLIGPRRIGKSSFLLHLCRPQVHEKWDISVDQFIFIYIDCQEIGDSSADEIYDLLVDTLTTELENRDHIIETPPNQSGYRALDRRLNRLKRAGLQVAILFDEFELLAANEQLTPYFFARLRGLTTKYGLAYLTASQRPLFDITADEEILSSPFFNIFVSIPLGLFPQEEAQEMWQARVGDQKSLGTNAIWEQISQQVGYHPFFLHIAGYHLWDVWQNNGTIDWEQINKVTEAETSDHLGYMWQTLTAEEQRGLVLLHVPNEVARVLELLCLITRQNGRYTYTSTLLESFIRRQTVADVVQFDLFVIDLQQRLVLLAGTEYTLTTSQFSLLICLVREAERMVPASELETAVWGEALIDDPDRLKTLIKRLRRAIEPHDKWIISGRGVGYALRKPTG